MSRLAWYVPLRAHANVSPMRSRTIFLTLFALVAACGLPDYGYAVRVDIDASSLADDLLARIGSLRLTFSGAESGRRTIPLDPGFFNGRRARFVYYPVVP